MLGYSRSGFRGANQSWPEVRETVQSSAGNDLPGAAGEAEMSDTPCGAATVRRTVF
jgi:hypothetical protein